MAGGRINEGECAKKHKGKGPIDLRLQSGSAEGEYCLMLVLCDLHFTSTGVLPLSSHLHKKFLWNMPIQTLNMSILSDMYCEDGRGRCMATGKVTLCGTFQPSRRTKTSSDPPCIHFAWSGSTAAASSALNFARGHLPNDGDGSFSLSLSLPILRIRHHQFIALHNF